MTVQKKKYRTVNIERALAKFFILDTIHNNIVGFNTPKAQQILEIKKKITDLVLTWFYRTVLKRYTGISSEGSPVCNDIKKSEGQGGQTKGTAQDFPE